MPTKKPIQLFRKASNFSGSLISPHSTADALDISLKESRSLLVSWFKKGWLQRIRRDLYIPIPHDVASDEVPIEEPWIVAMHLFSPCYIGGWSAASHYGLTDQIQESCIVLSGKAVRSSIQRVGSIQFFIRKIKEEKLFGTQSLWCGSRKILISDIHKTIVDCLMDPKIGGGIRHVFDICQNYFISTEYDEAKIVSYIKRASNNTIFKRLGFFLDIYLGEEESFASLISTCKDNQSKGITYLDPSYKKGKIISCWNLIAPPFLLRKRSLHD